MNDLFKTLIFVGVSAAVAVGAFLLRPAPFEQPRRNVGEKLFGEIEDAASADALEIVSFDRDQSKSVKLNIERDAGEWVIASHGNYPADASGAKERIQDVALKLMDLEVLDVASELDADHALFGVVEPPDEGEVAEADDKDIGLLVGLKDEDGNILARLIIGKEVRDEQSEDVKRFVRKADEPTIYTAQIETDDLKSKFSDWIESDLLKISGADLRQVTVKDYNAIYIPQQQATAIDPRFEMTVAWDSEESKWLFVDMEERKGNAVVPTKLADDEELNSQQLNDLKDAIADLKIVGVERKPKELIAGGKSDEELMGDPALRQLLRQKGFYPGGGELLASEGELRIQTDDAVEYILRFGQGANVELNEENESQVTRYMLVSAAVAEEQLVAKPADTTPPTGIPLRPPLGAGGQAGDDGESGDESNVEADTAEPEAEPNDDDPQPSDDPALEPQPDAPELPNTIPPGSDGEATPEDDPMVAQRKAAEEKVAELNKNFVNWFYIISEDEYEKLNVNREDLIQAKEIDSAEIDPLGRGDESPGGSNESID